jgi:DMSO/TMAO reductase YedYZ molybdopterin-dependent catalytic subunit
MPLKSRERGINELYCADPERADAIVFGRKTGATRRGFLGGSGLGAMAAMLGAPLALHELLPGGLLPRALAQAKAPAVLKMDGKAELIVLGDRPLVAETPAHLLDDEVTPTDKFFIRNNGQLPEPARDANAWEIAIDGEVHKPLKLTLGELKQRFRPVTLVMQLECGGNGRSFFEPQARGNQWTVGGVGCARWTGIPLADVLRAAELKPSATYTAHYGADLHLSGDASKPTISRGVRLPKALDPHTLLVYEMNGAPLPNVHGGPVRLLVPGWAGSASQKWLTRIWVRDREHDGPGMTGFSYRTPIEPGVPGGKFDEQKMRILESMPVRSIITNLKDGERLKAGTREVALRGHAWAGDHDIRAVEVSIDYGSSWSASEVKSPVNRYAWQNWSATIKLPTAGYYELWVRATDSAGRAQPFAAGNWNPQGYGANPLHRVRVLIEA